MISWLQIAANRRVLAYLLFTLVVLGAMLALGILPAKQELSDLEQEKERLQANIEEQEVLRPLYQELQQKLQDRELDQDLDLDQESSQELDIDSAKQILDSLADDSELQQASFTPRPETLQQETGLLLIQGELQGEYQNFQKFLHALLVHPDLSNLGRLQISSTSEEPEYALQIWMQVE
ncbi:MAG: hypothetical protein ACOC43_10540 [Desulfohalobiaceae bacterium]